ncbi:MAG: pirin family protein [Rhodospirillaceae bacterium]
MIEVIPFRSLGRFDNDWLNARYHFSFADYHDLDRMGLGPLRVWNDDTIRPDSGFPPHGHRDMEVITYVRTGAITHHDHLGNHGRTEAGNVQVMSAGAGITHSEYNRETVPAEIFQIWIQPDARGHPPRWESRAFPPEESAGRLTVLASGRPEDQDCGALRIHQNAAILGATLAAGQQLRHPLAAGRQVYLVAARGRFRVNGRDVGPRDGAEITEADAVTIEALDEGEIVLADLP